MWLYRIFSLIHPCWGEVSGRFARQCQAEVSRAARSCPWPGWAQPQEVLNKCRSILASAHPSEWTFYPAHPAFAFFTNSKPAYLLLRFFFSVMLLCLHGLPQRSCVHSKDRMQHDLEKQSCPWILPLVTFICTLHLLKFVPTDLQCFSEVQEPFSSWV